jgi:hypothetical protein
MPALTTARTTAFIPALSPPDVRTASFIVMEAQYEVGWGLGVGRRVTDNGANTTDECGVQSILSLRPQQR